MRGFLLRSQSAGKGGVDPAHAPPLVLEHHEWLQRRPVQRQLLLPVVLHALVGIPFVSTLDGNQLLNPPIARTTSR